MKNDLNNTRQNSQITLDKTKKLLNLTQKIISKQDFITNQNEVINFSDSFEAWIDTNTNFMWELKTVKNIQNIYSYNDATKYVDNLNHIKYAGFENWKLPNIDELKSIYSTKLTNDLYIKNPLVNNTDWAYWSNTNTENNDKLFVFYFNNGHKRSESKNFKCSIRCVRDNK